MVLLTAVNNIRQHRSYTDKKDNGYLRTNVGVNVGYVPVAESGACCGIEEQRIMEIERYYAAFPALGQTSEGLEKIPILSKESPASSKFSSPGGPDVNGNHTGGKSNHVRHTPPQSPHFTTKKKGNSSASPSSNNYHGKVNRRGNAKHTDTPKPCRKKDIHSPQRQNHRADHRRPKPVKIKDSKPWKQLTDIKSPPKQAANSSVTISKHEVEEMDGKLESLISDELLVNVLGEVPSVSDAVDNPALDVISSLWSEDCNTKNGSTDNVWEFNDCLSTRPKTSTAIQQDNQPTRQKECDISLSRTLLSEIVTEVGTNELVDPTEDENSPRSWSSDYEMIEQSLASLKFCEDVSEDIPGSRFAPMFRANPFCYMTKHGTHSTTEAESSVRSDAFTCQHCEETYEIVLQSEDAQPSKYYSNLFNHVDSRLDFDWTKYHPPPWSSRFEKESEAGICQAERRSCDCDFCRHKIWQKACKWCGTPQ